MSLFASPPIKMSKEEAATCASFAIAAAPTKRLYCSPVSISNIFLAFSSRFRPSKDLSTRLKSKPFSASSKPPTSLSSLVMSPAKYSSSKVLDSPILLVISSMLSVTASQSIPNDLAIFSIDCTSVKSTPMASVMFAISEISLFMWVMPVRTPAKAMVAVVAIRSSSSTPCLIFCVYLSSLCRSFTSNPRRVTNSSIIIFLSSLLF